MSDKNSSVVVEKVKRSRRLKLGRKAWIAIVVLVIAAASFGLYRRDVATRQCNGKDNSPIYTQATAVFEASKAAYLKKVVDKMQTMRNYETDASCQAANVQYFIYTGDSAKAREALAKLEKVYDAKVGFAKPYRRHFQNPNSLSKQIDLVDKFYQEIDNNKLFYN